MNETTQLSPAQMTDAQKIAYVKREMTEAGQKLREQHPWLKHQNAIGAGIMILALAGMIGSAALYGFNVIPWWVCVPAVAFFASLIHELEHDLIHLMYFRKNPKINKLMLIVGWIARPSTLNPLVRRRLHMHHHKHSGTKTDLEERSITNGTKWGLRRLLMTGDNMLSIYLRPIETHSMTKRFLKDQRVADKQEFNKLRKEVVMGYFPLGNIYYLAWHSWLAIHAILIGASLMGSPITLPQWAMSALGVLDFFAVVLMLPSFLRTFCLHFISSNMHYYGDVEDDNPLQQCQVLNVWWLAPLQLFCFNFGSTHAIHHFLVKEPFYIRQWTAPTGHRVLREVGVRFNDIGTFARNNRFYAEEGKAVTA